MITLHVRSFILGRYPIRGFLAWNAGDHAALFVDPGGWDDAIADALLEHKLTVQAIVLTHGHWDHTEGLAEMVARLQAPVYAHAADVSLLPVPPDVRLTGGEEIRCGAVRWRALSTPGHTAGCLCYTAGDVLFSGDTLFAGAIGGTADVDAYEQERQAIRETLFPLGDDILVYPAHGPATTVGVERRCNPFLR